MSIIKGLDIGKRAMMLQLEAVDSAGQNISKASLPGYSRQKVELNTVVYRSGDKLTSLETRRVRDEFIDRSIRSESQSLGDWEMRSRLYSRIEGLFLETDEHGLNSILAEFWNSWETAASNPENTAPRSVVAQYGALLAESINHIDSQLTDVQSIADGYLIDRVSKLNDLATQIANLNNQILVIETSVEEASEMRDQRDLLIDQMSKIADVRVITREDSISVLVGGRAIVDGAYAMNLGTRTVTSGDVLVNQAIWADDDTDVNITGGELAGLINIRDEIVPDLISQMDQLASTLITEVNAIHTTGYGANGSTGLDFFTGTSAYDMAVSSEIMADTDNIAISATGEPGDTSIALDIAALSTQNIAPGNMDVGKFLSDIVDDIGMQSQRASMMMENAEMLLSNLEEQKESVSGVSLDEETADLIRFQSAYASAARYVSVINEMIDILINIGE